MRSAQVKTSNKGKHVELLPKFPWEFIYIDSLDDEMFVMEKREQEHASRNLLNKLCDQEKGK